MTDFSTNLKKLRKSKNLSQQQIADNIGITQRTYSNYEAGISQPNCETLVKIANFFKIRLDELLGVVYSIADSKYIEFRD
jgi:transcriptional regulator with XRE-family HTH domain